MFLSQKEHRYPYFFTYLKYICIKIIKLAKNILLRVLKVKILSLAMKKVSKAKTNVETPKPTSLDDHKSPVESTIFLTAYQKHKLMGIANIATETNGLSSHHSQTNWELNWNHAKIFPMAKNITPKRSSTSFLSLIYSFVIVVGLTCAYLILLFLVQTDLLR